MHIVITPWLKGAITKAKNGQRQEMFAATKKYLTTRFKGVPAEQIKHATRKLLSQ